jgi:cytidylate kinase
VAAGATIVTIDGPAGTGKSSVAREVARRLGFVFLDTGAMYRAIGLEAHRREADLDDPRELDFVARHCRVTFDWSRDPPATILNGEDVSHLIRGGDATRAASYVATVPSLRERLVVQQRHIGDDLRDGGLVTEGRDQGSVVFPDATVKIFLTADAKERARRRVEQLRSRGEIVDERAILADMHDRDQRDAGRAVAPLQPADDAVTVDTTQMNEDQVVGSIIDLVRERS